MVGALLALVTITLAWLVVRRLRVLRAGGVHAALRTRLDSSGRNWQLGVGRYQGGEFAWFRVFSLRSGPDRVIQRRGLEIAGRREPAPPETYNMPVGAHVLHLRNGGSGPVPELELAMGPDALTGFLSWLESAPPGRLPWAS